MVSLVEKEEKMKYYSEKLKKLYNSVEELEKEELAEQERAEQKAAEEIKKSHKFAAEKKQAASNVEAAAEKVTNAYKHYIDEKNEANALINECNRHVKETLDNALQAISNAVKEYNDALYAFNDKFGPYKKVLTGDKVKTYSNINNHLFDGYFDPSLWIY